MARRGSGGGGGGLGGGGGMMAPIISIATGLLIFIVLVILAPTIAGSIEEAQPDFGDLCSHTNASGLPAYTDYGECGTFNTTALGDEYDTAYSADSYWNPDYNSDVPTGVDEWTTNVQILGVVILIISIAVAMYYLKGMA